MAATATAGSVAAAAPKVEEHMDPKRLIAFFAMVVGMFMAILDIQIVSASLAEIQAGLRPVPTRSAGCRPPISLPKSS